MYYEYDSYEREDKCFSEVLRDKAWDHLPNVARNCKRTVEANYYTSDPGGFLRIQYHPDNTVGAANTLNIIYVEPISVMTPAVEMLVSELIDQVPVEESKVDRTVLQQSSAPFGDQRLAMQIDCTIEATTGEIIDFSQIYGPLNQHNFVDYTVDEAESLSQAFTPEERLAALIFGITARRGARDPELEEQLTPHIGDYVGTLLGVFDRI